MLDPDEQTQVCKRLRQRLAGKEAELTEIESQTDNLVDQIGRTKDSAIRDRYETKVKALNERRASVEKEQSQTESELRKAESSLQSFKKWKRSLETLQQALAEDDVELRLRMRAHLREFIDKVEVFAVGFQKRYDVDEQLEAMESVPTKERWKARVDYFRTVESLADAIEDGISDCDSDWKPDKTFRDFCEYVTRRRMSKDGRFYRVHFKTGAKVDLVPPGSLASGRELVAADGRRKAGWRFVSPRVDQLWREYNRSKRNDV